MSTSSGSYRMLRYRLVALFCFQQIKDLSFADFMLFSLLICANKDFCRTLEARISFNTFPHNAAYICVSG